MVIPMERAWGQAPPSSVLPHCLAQGQTAETEEGASASVALRHITMQCLSCRLYRAEVGRGQERQAAALEEGVPGQVWWRWHVSSLLGLHLYMHASSFQTGPTSSTSSSASSPATGHLNWCVSAERCSWVVKESPWGRPLWRRRGGSTSPSQQWRTAPELAQCEKLSDRGSNWASCLVVLPTACGSREQRGEHSKWAQCPFSV